MCCGLKIPKVPKSQKSQSYIKREKRSNSLIINDGVNESHPLGLWDFWDFRDKCKENMR